MKVLEKLLALFRRTDAEVFEGDDGAVFAGDDIEITKQILLQTLNAKAFIRLASLNGFEVLGEDQLGVRIRGPNSQLILTVLASHDPDRIFTLAIKYGENRAFSLVDKGELLFESG